MRLPANLMQKYMLKAAEFYIGYVTRGPSSDAQLHGNTVFSKHFLFCTYKLWTSKKRYNYLPVSVNYLYNLLPLIRLLFVLGSQDGGSLKSPGVSRGSQRYVIDGLSEKSSLVAEPWERLLDILAIAGARCEWQGDKAQW